MNSPTDKIDFIDCASAAYRFIWQNAGEIARLSLIVISAEIVFFALIKIMGLSDNHLRQGLLLLPIFFLEGWVILRVVMMAFLSAAPKLIQTEDIPRNLKAGMIAFVLTQLMLAFLIGFTMDGQTAIGADPEAVAKASEPNMGMAFAMGLTTIFTIWAFRFVWLYLPILAGKDVFDFLDRIKGFGSSFKLLGIWILCFTPVMLFMILGSQLWIGFSNMLGQGEESVLLDSGLQLILIVADYFQTLVASVAVGFAVIAVYGFAGDEKS